MGGLNKISVAYQPGEPVSNTLNKAWDLARAMRSIAKLLNGLAKCLLLVKGIVESLHRTIYRAASFRGKLRGPCWNINVKKRRRGAAIPCFALSCFQVFMFRGLVEGMGGVKSLGGGKIGISRGRVVALRLNLILATGSRGGPGFPWVMPGFSNFQPVSRLITVGCA